MSFLKSMFGDLRTGSLRRLPYLGYSVFLFVLMLVLGGLLIFGGVALLAWLNLSMTMMIIIGSFYVVVSCAALYASIILTIKRMRNIGFQKPILYFIVFFILALLMSMLIEYLEITGPVFLYYLLSAFYVIFYISIQLFLYIAPESYVRKKHSA